MIPRATIPQPVTVNGITYKSTNAAGKSLGVHRSTAKTRLARGLSPEEAFSRELPQRVNPLREDLRALAEKHGLLMVTIVARYRRGLRGEALTCRPHDPKLPRKKCDAHKVVVAGREFASLKDAAAAYGVSYQKVVGRRNSGWTLAEAFELAPRATTPRPH